MGLLLFIWGAIPNIYSTLQLQDKNCYCPHITGEQTCAQIIVSLLTLAPLFWEDFQEVVGP